MKYQFTSETKEISGFGGVYEEICRKMLSAGLEWLDEHPQANPLFYGLKNIYGIAFEDNEDAKLLTKAIIDAANGDCTGAMHQAVIQRCLWIRNNGWDAYLTAISRGKLK